MAPPFERRRCSCTQFASSPVLATPIFRYVFGALYEQANVGAHHAVLGRGSRVGSGGLAGGARRSGMGDRAARTTGSSGAGAEGSADAMGAIGVHVPA